MERGRKGWVGEGMGRRREAAEGEQRAGKGRLGYLSRVREFLVTPLLLPHAQSLMWLYAVVKTRRDVSADIPSNMSFCWCIHGRHCISHASINGMGASILGTGHKLSKFSRSVDTLWSVDSQKKN